MSVFLDATHYLKNTTDSAWGNEGTIFFILLPGWFQVNGLSHVLILKANSTFDLTSGGWFAHKLTDNTLEIGFYHNNTDFRMIVASTVFVPTVWGHHLYDWDTTAALQRYYYENAMEGSRAGAFTVPTVNNQLTFGCFSNTGVQSDGASSYYACFGRWNRRLTDDEKHTLQITGCPLFIPRGLQEYHQFLNAENAPLDLMGHVPLTVSGTLAMAADPGTYSPASGQIAIAPLAPLPLTITAPVVSNAFSLFAPTVTVEPIPGVISPPLLSAPFQVFAPSLSFDLGLVPPLLDSSFTVYAPSVHVSESTIQEDSRELEPHNLKVRITDFVAGDDLRISRLYTELAEGIMITKGYLTIKRRAVDDADAEAIIQKTITTSMQLSGQIVDDDTTGGSIQLYFDLSHTETGLLTPLIPYQYDVQVHTIGSAIYTCEKGVIVMQQGVTEATS